MHGVVREICPLFSLLSVTSPYFWSETDSTRLDSLADPFLSQGSCQRQVRGGAGPETPETFRNNAVVTENAIRDTDAPLIPPTAASTDQN
jgi:hypothetical protein